MADKRESPQVGGKGGEEPSKGTQMGDKQPPAELKQYIYTINETTQEVVRVEQLDEKTGERKEIPMQDYTSDPYGGMNPYGSGYESYGMDPYSSGYGMDPYSSAYGMDPYSSGYGTDPSSSGYEAYGYDPSSAGYDPYASSGYEAYGYDPYAMSGYQGYGC